MTDIYSTITDQIIAGLSKGTQPWFQPWRDNGSIRRPLRADGIPYQGINVIVSGRSRWSEAAADQVTASWEGGDLAAAVRELDRAAKAVREAA